MVVLIIIPFIQNDFKFNIMYSNIIESVGKTIVNYRKLYSFDKRTKINKLLLVLGSFFKNSINKRNLLLNAFFFYIAIASFIPDSRSYCRYIQ